MSTFSTALELVKEGKGIQREGWNGSNLVVKFQLAVVGAPMTVPHLYIETPDGMRTPWLPSSSDLLAKDWNAV